MTCIIKKTTLFKGVESNILCEPKLSLVHPHETELNMNSQITKQANNELEFLHAQQAQIENEFHLI